MTICPPRCACWLTLASNLRTCRIPLFPAGPIARRRSDLSTLPPSYRATRTSTSWKSGKRQARGAFGKQSDWLVQRRVPHDDAARSHDSTSYTLSLPLVTFPLCTDDSRLMRRHNGRSSGRQRAVGQPENEKVEDETAWDRNKGHYSKGQCAPCM